MDHTHVWSKVHDGLGAHNSAREGLSTGAVVHVVPYQRHMGGHISKNGEVAHTWLRGGSHVAVPRRHEPKALSTLGSPALGATATAGEHANK